VTPPRTPGPRVHHTVIRRRRVVACAVLAAVVLLAVVLVRHGGGEAQPRPAQRVEARPKTKVHKHLHLELDWPSEGQAAVAVDGVGRLGARGGREPVPIASVAKVMTAYLVLKAHPLAPGQEGFKIKVGDGAVDDVARRLALNQSVVAVEAGEELSERQALEALLLPSGNNIAALLAVHEAGSVDAFVAEMNAAAAELGMGETRYTDPSGFEDTTVSTAADQLRLGRLAMNDPTFAQIVAMPTAVIPVAGEVTNLNALVGQEGFVGIKTGSDKAAGGCLLFAKRIHVNGHTRTMVGAVLGQRQGDFIEAALASAKSLATSATAAIRR
jgi:D-alanyl-D-alanine carboxypeptidase (penicillin-binding protein 5/6)